MKNELFPKPAETRSNEYLLFYLGDEEYAVDIRQVREIRGYEPVTRIVNTPKFLKGVINLRGEVVPIIDLRIRFHLPEVSYTPFTVVIILNIADKTMGIVVDGVSDVTGFSKADIRPLPDAGLSIDQCFMTELASIDDRLIVLLNIEKMLDRQELSLLNVTADMSTANSAEISS